MPAERLAGSARQRACESKSSELSENNLKANFAEFTFCAATDIREALLRLPGKRWTAGGLAQSRSLEAYFRSTTFQYSAETQLRPFCVFGLVWRRSEEHTSELQSLAYLVCRLLLEK